MQTVEDAIRQTALFTDEETYWLIGLPVSAITVAAGIVAEAGQVFTGLLADKDEVTLMLRDDVYETFSKRLRDQQISESSYRLITFELTLELSLVGFMARVSAVLADAGVPIMVYAAYSRDHILVPADKFDDAMTALQQLQESI